MNVPILCDGKVIGCAELDDALAKKFCLDLVTIGAAKIEYKGTLKVEYLDVVMKGSEKK
jgi:hypothetical protein